jgi:hypothetical protein
MANEDFRKALDSAEELNITFVGRKTGKKFSTPVWFVNDGEKVYLLPLNSASNWYRNVLKTPTMVIQALNKRTTAEVLPIRESKRVGEIVQMFGAKYGAGEVKKYYPRPDVAVQLSI